MKASKIISAALIGADFVNVAIGGRMYCIFPPTIEKWVGAAHYLSDFTEADNLVDIIKSINSSDKLAKALSWFIKGDESLSRELMKGTFAELTEGVAQAYSLLDVANFTRLSTLARNVARMTAKQK